MNKNENQNQTQEPHIKKIRLSRWLGTLFVCVILVAFFWTPPKLDAYTLKSVCFIGILICWLFDEQNGRADQIDAKINAIQEQLDGMPYEVRRKLYLKRGESYWPEMDTVISFIQPKPMEEDWQSERESHE